MAAPTGTERTLHFAEPITRTVALPTIMRQAAPALLSHDDEVGVEFLRCGPSSEAFRTSSGAKRASGESCTGCCGVIAVALPLSRLSAELSS
jgi:hypothetical protein